MRGRIPWDGSTRGCAMWGGGNEHAGHETPPVDAGAGAIQRGLPGVEGSAIVCHAPGRAGLAVPASLLLPTQPWWIGHARPRLATTVGPPLE